MSTEGKASPNIDEISIKIEHESLSKGKKSNHNKI